METGSDHFEFLLCKNLTCGKMKCPLPASIRLHVLDSPYCASCKNGIENIRGIIIVHFIL